MNDTFEGDDWTDGPPEELSSSLDFGRLSNILDPSEATTLSWHKIIDRKARTISFFQIQHPSSKPKISRCVRLRREKLSNFREVLEATVLLNGAEQLSFVRSILGKTYVDSAEGLTKLLKAVERADVSSGNRDIAGRTLDKVGARHEVDPAGQRLIAVLDKVKYPPVILSATTRLINTDKTKQLSPYKKSSRRVRELACAQQVDEPEVPATVAATAQPEVGVSKALASVEPQPEEPEVITVDDSDDEEWLPPRKKKAVQDSANMRGNFLDNLITRCLDNNPSVQPAPTLTNLLTENTTILNNVLTRNNSPTRTLPVFLPRTAMPFGVFDGLGTSEQPTVRVSVPLIVPSSANEAATPRPDNVPNVVSFVSPSARMRDAFSNVVADNIVGRSSTAEASSRLDELVRSVIASPVPTSSTATTLTRLVTPVAARNSAGPQRRLPTAMRVTKPSSVGPVSWLNVSNREASSNSSSYSRKQWSGTIVQKPRASIATPTRPTESNKPVPPTGAVTDILAQMPEAAVSSSGTIPSVPAITESDSGIVELMEKFYWNTPGEGQAPLVAGSYIHVQVKVLEELKSQYGPPKGKKWMKYAHHLAQHLIGGWGNVIKYKKKRFGVHWILGGNFIDTLATHLEDLFRTKVVKARLIKLLNIRVVKFEQKLLTGKKPSSRTKRGQLSSEQAQDMDVSDDDGESQPDSDTEGPAVPGVGRRKDPEAARRKRFLKSCYWTTAGEGRVQLFEGYDVYVDQQCLSMFTDLYGPTKVRRSSYGLDWSKYAECLFVHLSGGWDNVLKDKRPHFGSKSLLGPDVFRAVAGHIKKVFDNADDVDYLVKKVCKAWGVSVAQAKHRSTNRWPKKKTGLDPAVEAKEKFSEYLETCYWKTPGEDKIPLHPGFEIYVYPAILEDLKGQFGPGTPHPGPDVWSRYAINLYVHLISGWDNLMKYKRSRVGVSRMMDDDFFYAVLGHLRDLFKITMTKRQLVTKLDGALQVYRLHQYNPEEPERPSEQLDESHQVAEESAPEKNDQLTILSGSIDNTEGIPPGESAPSAVPKTTERNPGDGWEKYYWSSSGIGRVHLCPGYEIYVDQRVLEEIVSQFGPKKYGSTQWGRYTNRLFNHLIGGWKNYLKDRMEGTIVIDKILGDDFCAALAEHVQEVFQVPIDKGQFVARLNSYLYSQRLKARNQLKTQKSSGNGDSGPEEDTEAEGISPGEEPTPQEFSERVSDVLPMAAV